MTDKEISDILEAYQQVYTHQEEVEQLDELKAATDKNVAKLLAKRDREDKDSGGISRGFMARRRAHQSAERRNQRTGSNVKVDPILSRPSYDPRQARLNMEMEYDAFDAILEHLVSEGYADTNESALAIMANMSEEWRESIVEELEQLDEISLKTKISAAARRGTDDFESGEDATTKSGKSKFDKTLSHIEKRHGPEAARHAVAATDANTFGRTDRRTGKSQPRPEPRIQNNRKFRTRAKDGKMHGQDQAKLKSDLKKRSNQG